MTRIKHLIQLRDKDKSTVKDRFKNFNSEFEDVVAKHQRSFKVIPKF